MKNIMFSLIVCWLILNIMATIYEWGFSDGQKANAGRGKKTEAEISPGLRGTFVETDAPTPIESRQS